MDTRSRAINAPYEVERGAPEIKALALDALDIKVYAKGTDSVEIQGVIPLELALPTTARTSGLQLIQTYDCDLVTGHIQMSTSVVPSSLISFTH